MKRHTAGEDYLEAILILKKKKGNVRSVDVARQLNVSKPSVSYAVSLLKDCGHITVDGAYNLHLTEAGLAIAEHVYEKHCFFRDVLISAGVESETAEAEACMMEHAISNSSFRLLKEKADQDRRKLEKYSFLK